MHLQLGAQPGEALGHAVDQLSAIRQRPVEVEHEVVDVQPSVARNVDGERDLRLLENAGPGLAHHPFGVRAVAVAEGLDLGLLEILVDLEEVLDLVP